MNDRLEAYPTFSQQSDLANAELNRSFTTKLSMISWLGEKRLASLALTKEAER